jgi:hypothetical protein
MRVLKSSPRVAQASLFGAGIHSHSEKLTDLSHRKRNTSSGLTPFHLEPIQPSLEDVYLSLVEGNREP